MAEVFANSEDPDQTPCCATSDLGLHCLPVSPAHKGLRVCNIFTMTFPELSWYQSLLA